MQADIEKMRQHRLATTGHSAQSHYRCWLLVLHCRRDLSGSTASTRLSIRLGMASATKFSLVRKDMETFSSFMLEVVYDL